MAQTVKNPPAMQEIWVQSQGGEDLLEKEMATHSSIPAWEIPWTEEPGGLVCGVAKNQIGQNDSTASPQAILAILDVFSVAQHDAITGPYNHAQRLLSTFCMPETD